MNADAEQERRRITSLALRKVTEVFDIPDVQNVRVQKHGRPFPVVMRLRDLLQRVEAGIRNEPE